MPVFEERVAGETEPLDFLFVDDFDIVLGAALAEGARLESLGFELESHFARAGVLERWTYVHPDEGGRGWGQLELTVVDTAGRLSSESSSARRPDLTQYPSVSGIGSTELHELQEALATLHRKP